MMVELPQTTSATVEAIDRAVAAKATPYFQNRISGGQIGRACERSIWYQRRWAVEPETFSGRMLRLFDTGHVEEDRMIAWLRLIGAMVEAVDPATGEQWEVTGLDGHFVGKLDGIVTGIPEAPKTPHLLECKTHNAKSFAQLKKHGVAVSKPEHVAQMQSYMHLHGLTRGLYLAKCKDNDELHAERIRYDADHAIALMAKAERIRDANHPPARIADDPCNFICKWCPASGVCHFNEFALRNCRTCIHSSPVPGGAWRCARHDRDLTIQDQKAGCPNHLYLPGLVPGEQTDADQSAETVTYEMADGTQWIDGGKEAAQ